MSESVFDQILRSGEALGIDTYMSGIPGFAAERSYSEEQLAAIREVFAHIEAAREESVAATLLSMSRLPIKQPKTFESFDFTRIHCKSMDALMSLKTLAPLYARRNLAFIGPQGVGKTHLAMAFGRECCRRGMKVYYLKASELSRKLSESLKFGRSRAAVNGLVRPSCLIIDEVGRCKFDRESTRLFFDVVDKRCEKDGPNTIIFTSNKTADKWGEFFSEDDSLLCALDRIFDNATVFMIKGESYRGRGLETILVQTGAAKLQTK
ncbi:MAG: ATP-binding protein [Lachnospiraceae bacterium]|nr:ATP-binding protein [Lachnospiraceae bacterium]